MLNPLVPTSTQLFTYRPANAVMPSMSVYPAINNSYSHEGKARYWFKPYPSYNQPDNLRVRSMEDWVDFARDTAIQVVIPSVVGYSLGELIMFRSRLTKMPLIAVRLAIDVSIAIVLMLLTNQVYKPKNAITYELF